MYIYVYVCIEWVTGRIRWVSEWVWLVDSVILGAWIELLSEWVSDIYYCVCLVCLVYLVGGMVWVWLGIFWRIVKYFLVLVSILKYCLVLCN